MKIRAFLIVCTLPKKKQYNLWNTESDLKSRNATKFYNKFYEIIS